MVDLIKPLSPPWTVEAAKIGDDPADLAAVEIAGLSWRESAPAFETTVIDERGEPLRIVTSDPRVFAAHNYWLSKRSDREMVKKRRDGEQAKIIAALVATYMPYLPFEYEQLRMLPKELFEKVKPLFAGRDVQSSFSLDRRIPRSRCRAVEMSQAGTAG
jgi:hypothetical protein